MSEPTDTSKEPSPFMKMVNRGTAAARSLDDPVEPTPSPPEKTPEERKLALTQAIQRQLWQGWRVESQADYQAVVVKGHRPNHILHLLLSLITLGLWFFVWILVMVFGGEKRRMIWIDAQGDARW